MLDFMVDDFVLLDLVVVDTAVEDTLVGAFVLTLLELKQLALEGS